jgi:hypothetical protein
MKNAMFLALLLLLQVPLLASGGEISAEDRCRTDFFSFPDDWSAAQRMKADLTSGLWAEEYLSSDAKTLFQFHDYGLVDILRFDEIGEADFSVSMWRIETFDGAPFLVLSNSSRSEEKLYKLEATCRGMSLTDVLNFEKKHLAFKPNTSSKKVARIQMLLKGEWTNATYPFDSSENYLDCPGYQEIEGAFIEYEFSADGTYRRTYGSKQIKLEETGYFEVSNNGDYLIFHALEGDNPEDVYATTVVELKYLSAGEMVLHQPIRTLDFGDFLCREVKDVAFMQ